MADRLYLSLWLENHSALAMHRNFAVALRKFPFSTQAPQCYFRVSAVDPSEPALLEQVYKLPEQLEEIVEDMEKWRSTDSCFEIEGFWDLWQALPEGWRLVPSRVNLFFYGPDYPTELGESIRFELGIEPLFVPEPNQSAETLHFYQSNIKSLLRLTGDAANSLRLADRKLWSESPQSLADRLRWLSDSASSSRH
jgi:hypothetical protein